MSRTTLAQSAAFTVRHVAMACCAVGVLTAALACAAAPKAGQPEPRPLTDQAALDVIERVRANVATVRGLPAKEPLGVYVLDSATLKSLIDDSFEKSFPERKRHAVERFLRSLRVIDDDTDLQQMFLALLDEQVGGLYDPDTKRLFVREGYDIVGSAFARTVLAHEICHSLQDSAFDLRKMGIEVSDDDDRAEAAATVAEGDAMVAMGEYAARFELDSILKDMPGEAVMNQSALEQTPYFFRQMLLYPYVQGQTLVALAESKGARNRDRLFREPPTTTEQVMHPERCYFGVLDTPSPLALVTTQTATGWFVPRRAKVEPPLPPDPPRGFRRMEVNRLGELGVRLLLEERLGMGMATMASEGWDGDAYLICEDRQGRSWFCLETAWDTPRDATEFLGAFVTLWRSIGGDAKLGDLRAPSQEFTAGPWKIHIELAGKRVVAVWSN